jgi:hypothetical protein
MRHLMTAFVVVGSMVVVAAADRQTGAGKPAPIGACSLLSPAEVKKIARPNDQLFDKMSPDEEKLGTAGSACSYSGVTVQLDPFPPARLEQLRNTTGKDWAAVSDVGDAAYFRDNRGSYAEVYARAGQHVITVQLDVPQESSVESVRPAAIALAKALIAKLR